MSSRICLIAAAMIVAACDASAPAATPEMRLISRVREVIPVDETIRWFSACAGEEIEFHFVQEIRIQEVITDQTEHFHAMLVDKGSTGLGLASGAHYVLNGGFTHRVTGRRGFLRNEAFANLDRFIGLGGAPNIVVREFYRLTIDATGDVVFEVSGVDVQQCG